MRNPTRTLDRLEGEPENELNLLRKAVAHHRNRSTDKALSAVNRLISFAPKRRFYVELKGQILLESNRALESDPRIIAKLSGWHQTKCC